MLTTIDALAGAKVGVIGDLLADVYVSGESERVSREAPVLIVRYEREWLRPGGAANVAANIAALGATARLVGIVGEDEIGRRLLEVLECGGADPSVHPPPAHDRREAGAAERSGAGGDSGQSTGRGASGFGSVRCDGVLTVPERATITKTRFLAGAKFTSRQQVLRLDREPAQPPVGRLLETIARRVADVDPEVDAWVISDYGYGGFDDALRGLLRDIAGGKPVVADSRWDLHRFSGMTVIKPNEQEAWAAARALAMTTDVDALAGALAAKLHARAALITLGNKGMVLASDGEVTAIPAVGTEEIVDLTGAGDAVAATLTTAMAAGADVLTAARLANHAGGIVVMKEGAATASPEDLRASVGRGGGGVP